VGGPRGGPIETLLNLNGPLLLSELEPHVELCCRRRSSGCGARCRLSNPVEFKDPIETILNPIEPDGPLLRANWKTIRAEGSFMWYRAGLSLPLPVSERLQPK
jgi:hypothetical protein